MKECYGDYFYFRDKLLPAEQCDDSFIRYGTTIYEVIRIKNCIPLFVEKYFVRLSLSALRAGLSLWIDAPELKKIITEVIEANCVTEEDSLKLVFSFDNTFYGQKSNIFAAYMMRNNAPTEEQYKNGVHTVSLRAERDNPNAKIFNHSLRALTEKLIAKHNAYEVILVNESGFVTEGSRSNLFFIKEGTLYTSEVHKVLPGITRSNVLELAEKNSVPVVEKDIPYDEIASYDAAFITGTSRKILPVRTIDDIEYDVNNQLLRNLMQWYYKLIDEYIESRRQQWDICKNC